MNNKQERTLHLIDIENLIGSPSPTVEEVGWCHHTYQALHVAPTDQFVVACSHHAAPNVFWEWPQGCHRWRSGENGADSALLDVITQDSIADRFGCVVLASGDGIFTKAVAGLGQRGVDVTVVSRPESLSSSLRRAATQISLFPYPPTTLHMFVAPV